MTLIKATGTAVPNDPNELLQTSPTVYVYEGVPLVTIRAQPAVGASWGGFKTSTLIDSFGAARVPYAYYSQPVSISSATPSRVRIPVNFIGNGAPLTVGIYNDNAGVPGTLVTGATIMTVPAKFIAAASNLNSEYIVALTPPSQGPGGPQLVNWSFASGSNYAVVMGTQNPATGPANYVAYFAPITSSGFGTWTSVPPISPNENQNTTTGGYNSIGLAVTPTTGNAYAVGGALSISPFTDSASVFHANIGTDGSFGTWVQQQGALPVGLSNSQCAASDSHLYVGGGFFNSGGSYTYQLYYATITASGDLGTFSTTNGINTFPFGPTVTNGITSLNVVGNYLVATGLLDNIGGGVFPRATAVSLLTNGIPGPWRLVSQTNANSGPNPVTAVGGTTSVGSTVLFDDSSASMAWGLRIDPNDIAAGQVCLHANANTSALTLGSVYATSQISTSQWSVANMSIGSSYSTTYSMNAIDVPYVSVPLFFGPGGSIPILNGTYHIVIRAPAATIANDTQLLFSSISGPGGMNFLDNTNTTAPSALGSQNGSTWTNLQVSIPIIIYDNSTSGRLVHVSEASGTSNPTWHWLVTKKGSGVVSHVFTAVSTASGEIMAQTTALLYSGLDPSGGRNVLTQTGSALGWGNSRFGANIESGLPPLVWGN